MSGELKKIIVVIFFLSLFSLGVAGLGKAASSRENEIKDITTAAEAGDDQAQNHLAFLYLLGNEGLPQD